MATWSRPSRATQRAASFARVVVLPTPVGPTSAYTPPLRNVSSEPSTGRCVTSSLRAQASAASASSPSGMRSTSVRTSLVLKPASNRLRNNAAPAGSRPGPWRPPQSRPSMRLSSAPRKALIAFCRPAAVSAGKVPGGNASPCGIGASGMRAMGAAGGRGACGIGAAGGCGAG